MFQYEAKDGTQVLVFDDVLSYADERLTLAMCSKRYRPKLQKAFADVHAEERRLSLLATDEQRKLDGGDCWVRRVQIPFNAHPMVVFGRVMPLDEIRRREEELGAPPLETAHVVRGFRETRARGWLYGLCYSAREPQGEFGSTHMAHVQPISEAEFDAARNAGWRV